MSTLTIVSSVEGWTMPDDAGDTVSLKCCASSFASLSSVGSVLEKDQQIVAALVNIIPSSENARSPRDPPHMTAEGSRFRVHPNSHLQFLNTQRITHVVICGTGTTSGSNVWSVNNVSILSLPIETCEPCVQLLDKALDGDGVILVHSPQGHNRAMLILVSGACDGSDVAEPADSDEAIVRIVHSSQNVVQPGSATDSVCAECAYCSESEAPQLTGATSEPTSGTEPAGSILQSGDARRHRMPLKLAKTSPLLSQCAGTILGAPDDSGIDGSWKPKLSALRTIEQNALRRQGSAGHCLRNRRQNHFAVLRRVWTEIRHRRTHAPNQTRPLPNGMPGRPHSHKSRPQRHWIRWPPPRELIRRPLPAALLAPTAHPLRRQRTTTQTALAPRRPHSQTPFASEGPRELERTAESCSCDDAPVLAREWDALAATLEASPKVGLAPHNPPTPSPLPQNTAVCILRSRREGCGCDEEAPFLIVSPIGLGGSAVVARSLSLVRVPSSFFLRVLFCFEARHYLAVLFCAESRCRFLFWQCLALCVLPFLACS
ncbi:hypothetical protein BLNAU_15080 [Blattamonas nauphoetae]|uniref:Uncharacterized protein n=1 Tax=Blattamonas nauphoetae TaxID=2049346 RepID=A0ABQ9XF56_9EUKA|nr:hypothetical protein BLNAU_15080 [Blattamonas nauphoetae]